MAAKKVCALEAAAVRRDAAIAAVRLRSQLWASSLRFATAI
jgi:hypothetical protein